MILAIDFSRTIENSEKVEEGRKLGPPIKGAKESIIELKGSGHEIIIHSVLPTQVIKDWMEYFEIPYDLITRLKPLADVYLDDKGLCFTSWEQAMSDILKLDGRPKT